MPRTEQNQESATAAEQSIGLLSAHLRGYVRSLTGLFFIRRGRLSRGRFWQASLAAWLVFWLCFALLDGHGPLDFTRVPAALLIGSLFCLCSKRYHDLDRSSVWLTLLLVPVIGLLIVACDLGLRRGSVGENGYGADPRDLRRSTRDYATVS